MIWLVPFLLFCLFLLFRFVSPYEFQEQGPMAGFLSDATPSVPSAPSAPGNVVEEFQTLLVSPDFQRAYGQFLVFHREFQSGWRDALDTADSMSQEAGTPRRERTDGERNTTVRSLSQVIGKPFPLLVTLPDKVETLDDLDRSQLLIRIPSSAQPYQDALDWMNQALLKAQEEVDKVMKGGIPGMEGFQDLEGFAGDTCAEISQCFKDNPELARQLLAAQQADAATRIGQIQQELMGRFQQFQQPRLRSAFDLNVRLRANAKEIQRKAQSGDWIKDIKIGGGEGTKYTLPPGADALEEMCRKNPGQCAELRKSPFFSVKQLIEQINRNLR